MNKLQNVSEDMGMMDMVREYYHSYMTDADLKNIKATDGATDAPRPDPLMREKFKVIQETQTAFERLGRYDKLADQYNELVQKMNEKDKSYKKLISKYEVLVQDFMKMLNNPKRMESSLVEYNHSPHKHSNGKRFSPDRSPKIEIPRHRGTARPGYSEESFEIDQFKEQNYRPSERNSPGGFIEGISEIDRRNDNPQESSIEGVKELVERNDRHFNGSVRHNQHQYNGSSAAQQQLGYERTNVQDDGIRRLSNDQNYINAKQNNIDYFEQQPKNKDKPAPAPIMQNINQPPPNMTLQKPPQSINTSQSDSPNVISQTPPPPPTKQEPVKEQPIIQTPQPTTTPPPPPKLPTTSSPVLNQNNTQETPIVPPIPSPKLQTSTAPLTQPTQNEIKSTVNAPPVPPAPKQQPSSNNSSYSVSTPPKQPAKESSASNKNIVPATLPPPPPNLEKKPSNVGIGDTPPPPPIKTGVDSGAKPVAPPPINKTVSPPPPPLKGGSNIGLGIPKSSSDKDPTVKIGVAPPPPPPGPGLITSGKATPPGSAVKPPPGVPPPPPLGLNKTVGGVVPPPPPPPKPPANINNSYFTVSSKDNIPAGDDSYNFASNKSKPKQDDSYDFASAQLSKKSEKGNSFLSASKPGEKSGVLPPKDDQSKNSYFVDDDDDYLN